MGYTTKVLAALLLVSASLHPAMAGPSSRTVTTNYGGELSTIMIQLNDEHGVHFALAHSEEVPREEGERFVTVEIADASGEPVVGLVHQGKASLGIVCGTGKERFALDNRQPIHLHLAIGFSTECSAGSFPSEGTITLTFHK